MRKVSKALVAGVITSAAIVAVSGVGQAAESRPTLPKDGADDRHPPVNTTATDGYFYVWADGMGLYATLGNEDRWPWHIRNKADEVLNNGYVGGRDHVNIYWGSYYQGAYACISPGTWWNLRDEWQRFNWVHDGDYRGYRERVHDNSASHRWVHYCGNNTW